jgi:hypothetical protein
VLEDLLLAGRERRALFQTAHANLPGDAGLRLRREHGLPARDRGDRVGDRIALGVLAQVRRRAGRDGLEHQRSVEEGREDRDSGGKTGALHRASHFEPVHVRHLQVDHRHVRRELAHEVERLAPGARLAHELEVRALAHRAHDRLPEERVVVGDDNASAVR